MHSPSHPCKKYSPNKRRRDLEMDNPYHDYLLILNEDYIAGDDDVCRGCNEKIFSGKSNVYSCSSRGSETSSTNTGGGDNIHGIFLLHKTCAELPLTITNPTNQIESLVLRFHPRVSIFSNLAPNKCYICGIPWRWFSYCTRYDPFINQFIICIKCAITHFHSSEDRNFNHPSHPQHKLTLVQRPSLFSCDACKVNDNNRDLSYICTKCPFWMHKSCAQAPTSFQFQFHDKHPLILSYSLPKVYRKFDQYCRLCNDSVGRLSWIYHCPKCRFFAHFQCARSSRMLSSDENEKYDSDLVHLPSLDESSVNLLYEQFVKDMSTPNNNNNSNGNFSTITCIKHWTHDKHHLQLITIKEFDEQKDDDEMLLVCGSCVKPIQTDGDLFYACVPCKYYLHKVCAELLKEIEHHLWPHKKLLAHKLGTPYNLFSCDACPVACNGIFFSVEVGVDKESLFFSSETNIRLHMGCAMLPKIIKHEAHRHKLKQVYTGRCPRLCKACGKQYFGICKHGCEECDFYVCEGCIMKPRRVEHPWDSHPLNLIYEPGLAMDHEHEFNCEFCSEDIDANRWFYHCNICDLSFHLDECFERSCYRKYSNVKFGASNIFLERIHDHSLTFVLNKKVRSCEICNKKQLGEPVLECAAQCKAIFCIQCCNSDDDDDDDG